MKSFIEELQDSIMRVAGGQRISRIVIGVRCTYVELDDGGAGVVYTNREGEISKSLPGRIVGMRVEEALNYLTSTRGLEISLGLAVANALVNRSNPLFEERDAVREEELAQSDVIVFIGYFPSYVKRLKNRVREIRVLEMQNILSEEVEVSPWWSFSTVVRDATWLFITGASISNHTINYILPLSAHVKNKVVFGPSTPMIPDPFKRYNVRGLGGSIVVDRDLCYKIVSEGGGVRELLDSKCLKKVYLEIR
ncbi:MAG: DUF364 domain-containing protein [Sulfolobales archaeon]